MRFQDDCQRFLVFFSFPSSRLGTPLFEAPLRKRPVNQPAVSRPGTAGRCASDNRIRVVQSRASSRRTGAGRHACRSLEQRAFTRRFGPNYVRATIHRAFETPVLGLRIYPDYKMSSQQLPYHGVPLLYRDGDRVKMLVAPETRFYGDPTLERVTHNNGETYFYQSVK